MERRQTEDQSLLTRVSYHAVVRYVQRIKKVAVAETGCVRTDANAHAKAIGLTIDEVRQAILTPTVVYELDRKRPNFAVTPRFCVPISRYGTIITVLEPGMREKKGLRKRDKVKRGRTH